MRSLHIYYALLIFTRMRDLKYIPVNAELTLYLLILSHIITMQIVWQLKTKNFCIFEECTRNIMFFCSFFNLHIICRTHSERPSFSAESPIFAGNGDGTNNKVYVERATARHEIDLREARRKIGKKIDRARVARLRPRKDYRSWIVRHGQSNQAYFVCTFI